MTRPYTQNRHPAINEKIGREQTGLNGSLFVHVEWNEHGDLDEIRFSEKSKDGSSLERVLTALGDTVTGILRDMNKARANP